MSPFSEPVARRPAKLGPRWRLVRRGRVPWMAGVTRETPVATFDIQIWKGPWGDGCHVGYIELRLGT